MNKAFCFRKHLTGLCCNDSKSTKKALFDMEKKAIFFLDKIYRTVNKQIQRILILFLSFYPFFCYLHKDRIPATGNQFGCYKILFSVLASGQFFWLN